MTTEEPKPTLNFHEFKYYSDDEIYIQIQHKFSKPFDISLIVGGLFSIILPIYNVLIIYQNFFAFYNTSTHIYILAVTYFEFIAINFLLFIGLIKFINCFHQTNGSRLFNLDQLFSSLQFNLFSLVRLLSFKGIFLLFSNARRHGELESEHLIQQRFKEKSETTASKCLKLFAIGLYFIFYTILLLFITVSVFTKLSLVSFIGDVPVELWTYHHLFLFIGIVNNLSSLADGDEITLHFMWKILNEEFDVIKGEWKREQLYSSRMSLLYGMMYQISRWKAFLCIRIMNGRELHDLVRRP